MSRGLVFGAVLVLLMSAGCGGKMPEDLGVKGAGLSPCPESPNCVSSFATDEGHAIDAFLLPDSLPGSGDAAWTELVSILDARDDVEIVRNDGGYLHAVFTTPLMRYRDDVEFLLRAEAGEIAVRSASRVGYGDMGANRDRVEAIRAALAAKGLVGPA